MAEIKISCPSCNQHIQCDEGYRGMKIDCPSCQNGFVVPTVNGKNPPKKKSHKEIVAEITEANRIQNSKNATNTSNARFLKYICPHCKKECSVSSDIIGRDVSCQHCSGIFNARNPQSNYQESLPPKTAQSESVTTRHLEGLVKDLIQKKHNVTITEISLTHLSGDKFKGTYTITSARGIEDYTVDVGYNDNAGLFSCVPTSGSFRKQGGGFPQKLVGLIVCIVFLCMAGVIPNMKYNDIEETTAKYIASCNNLNSAYNAGANLGAPQDDLSVIQNRQDIAQAMQSMKEIKWKKIIIVLACYIGAAIGVRMMLSGERLEELHWPAVFMIWACSSGIYLFNHW